MTTRLFLALAGALLIVRLPSLAQPMGADQGLYSYVGERIRHGGVPYVDAWDQKPPAIHYTYAALRTLWPDDGVVAAADIAAAAAVGWLLFRLGSALLTPAAGAASGLVFLLLSNPSFTRLSGVRLRAQCETFIAVAIAGAFVLLARRRHAGAPWASFGAGILLGIAVTFKYNAAIYAAPAVAALWLWRRLTMRDVVLLAAGAAVPVLMMLAVLSGAIRALYDATITYNVQYSGETYGGPADVVRYLVLFPIERARVDALWTVGGAGCLILLARAARDREQLVPVLWVAAACASIAINGSRGLPQYFVQANPALAAAAGMGAVAAWTWIRRRFAGRAPLAGLAAVLLITIGVWRVNQFPKLVEQTAFDARRALGNVGDDEYLARYADDRKYSAHDAARLASYLREHSAPGDDVYVFGFMPSAYVNADRVSASRFFWSRPVIAGFLDGTPGYGASGLLADLEAQRPRIVALQRKDWAPDVADSADYFLSRPELRGWLLSRYRESAGPDAFSVWIRKADER